MARNYKNQRKPYRKKSKFQKYSGYAMTTANVASKALGTALMVKKLLNVEFKYADYDNNITLTATPTTGTGQIVCINTLQEGSGPSNRDGNQVEFKNFNMHFSIASQSIPSSIIRMIVFKWKGQNGATPTVATVLNTATPAPYTLAHYNLDNVPQNIQILSDKSYSTDENMNYVRKSLNISKEVKTRYQANTGAFTDVSTNGVFVMFLCDVVVGSSYPVVRLTTRSRYIDN